MTKRIELPELEVRRWDGETWPEKRISIAAADIMEGLGEAKFVSARYADLDEAQEQAEEIARRCNNWPHIQELASELKRKCEEIASDEDWDELFAPVFHELKIVLEEE